MLYSILGIFTCLVYLMSHTHTHTESYTIGELFPLSLTNMYKIMSWSCSPKTHPRRLVVMGTWQQKRGQDPGTGLYLGQLRGRLWNSSNENQGGGTLSTEASIINKSKIISCNKSTAEHKRNLYRTNMQCKRKRKGDWSSKWGSQISKYLTFLDFIKDWKSRHSHLTKLLLTQSFLDSNESELKSCN